MNANKDRPYTWVKYKESLCRKCIGNCCTMPVEVKIEDLVRLGVISEDDVNGSRRKLVNRLKREGVIQSYREVTGLFMLVQRVNDDCLYLDESSRLCTVYEKRPDVCRAFPERAGIRPGFCPAKAKY